MATTSIDGEWRSCPKRLKLVTSASVEGIIRIAKMVKVITSRNPPPRAATLIAIYVTNAIAAKTTAAPNKAVETGAGKFGVCAHQ